MLVHPSHAFGLLAALSGCGELRQTSVDAQLAKPDAGVDAELGKDAGSEPSDAIPRFATALYVDIGAIARISRFRAGVGHDFSDTYESCRSMKHYFFPRASIDWTTLVVRSPVSGTVVRLEVEQTFGTQLHIVPTGHAEWTVRIFHVTPSPALEVGDLVSAGDPIGTHASGDTLSDIAVQQVRPDGFRLVSYIDTLGDAPRDELIGRGVASPDALVISRAERDLDPLVCDGGAYVDPGHDPGWVELP